MAKVNYGKLSIEELERLIEELMAKGAAIREDKREIQRVLSGKYAERAARERVAGMEAGERAALVQALAAEGIESAEAFGTL